MEFSVRCRKFPKSMTWGILESARQSRLHFPTEKLCGFGQYASRASFFVVVHILIRKTHFGKSSSKLDKFQKFRLGYRLLHLNGDIVFIRPMSVSPTRIFFGGIHRVDTYSKPRFELFRPMAWDFFNRMNRFRVAHTFFFAPKISSEYT